MRIITPNGAILIISILLAGDAWAVSEGQSRAREKCTTVIVGKDATADGSVILGHNEDWGVYEIPLQWSPGKKHGPGATMKLKNGQVIPQVKETYSFTWPAATCNGINEFQVMIVNNYGSCRKELSRSQTGIEFPEFVAIVLQRSRTAREAVEIMGQLIDRYGFKCDAPDGDVFSVADPNEGWWIEITPAGQWVAQRVPNDSFVVIANNSRIGAIDPNDPSRFLASANLVEYARQKGWYDPAHGPFEYFKAYGEIKDESLRREWRGNCLLGGRTFNQDERLQAVVPTRKLRPQDIMVFLRDHFEGTEYDLTKGYEEGSPHHTSERVICRMYTDASTVAQLRSWLPYEIGGVYWIAVGTPCSSAYIPYYLGVTDFARPYAFLSDKYDRDNAFWVFNSLENLVDQYYGEVTRDRVSDGTLKHGEIKAIEYVSRHWRTFEDKEFDMQAAVEKTALDLYQKDKSLACSFLTMYSNTLGLQAFIKAQEMADTLRTKYYK